MAVYALHPAALATLFADVESFARVQDAVFIGTAGSVLKRRNASGFEFYAHQYYDALGAKRERYVAGPVGEGEADSAAEALRKRIEDVRGISTAIRLLGREGFQLVDSRTFATLAALHNHAIFAAGAVLVGTHAYGVLLNRLGIRGVSYRTEDVDIARGGRLTFTTGTERVLGEILRGSGLDFVEVPRLDPRLPSTSFKERGRSTFQVELLAPARGEEAGGSVPVPELSAHAVTLPFLGYLLRESSMTAILAREGCCAVRVPVPERFAVHKLLVSDLRRGRDAKVHKDRAQALVLCAALGDLHPGALAAAVEELPRSARSRFRRALRPLRADLENDHARAWEELNGAS